MSEIFSAGNEKTASVSSIVPATAEGASGAEGIGSDIDAPAVVAIVVACDPGEHFAETLASLGQQDYENLSVLVVDAGSKNPIADRVAQVLPEAYLHRITGDPGWSVAANQSIELVSGSPFLLFCHDDIALDRQCVSTLMGELYRNNGGIAGPKLVDWHDDRRLLQLGMSSDRFGVLVDQIDRGEFDQGQHDSVSDVFVIPGGVQLVRSDLFTALGGFDPEIPKMGEDLDFCWRAHIAGARVLVVPNAKARHLESMHDRISPRERRRLTTRHRLRTVLTTATRRSYFTIVPLAIGLVLLEALVALATGRRAQARDVIGAIGWSISRFGEIPARRRQLSRLRTVDDAELRKLQVGGSARIAAFSRGQVGASQERLSGLVGSVRSSFVGEDTGSVRDATVIAAVLGAILIFGSRQLFSQGVTFVGEIPDAPDFGTLIREWLGGWRTVGTGGPGNAPTALFFLALGRMLFFWSPGLFDTLLVVGPILLGPIGVYRLARPFGSARAGAIGAALYASCPIVVSAVSAARWEALVVWAAAPFLLASLLRLGGTSSFGSSPEVVSTMVAERSAPVRLLRFGFLVAFVASFATAIIPVAIVMVLCLLAVSALYGREVQELALAVIVAVVAPVALHGPWAFDSLQNLRWRWIVGPESPETDFTTMLELLQFAPGAPQAQILALGSVVAAALALVVVKGKHSYFAAAGWAMALVFFLLSWVARRDWLPFSLPTTEILLTPAAVGLALAVVVGVRSLEGEFRGDDTSRSTRFLAASGGFAIVCGMSVLLLSGFGGRWELPEAGFSQWVDIISRDRQQDKDFALGRVLWIGDESVLPVDAFRTESGISYAISETGRTEVRGKWTAGPVGSTASIGEKLDLASDGEVVRLGRLLAPYGIGMIVIVEQLAPTPYDGPQIGVDRDVMSSLSQQLDLERIPGIPSATVFSNTSASGLAPIRAANTGVPARTTAEQLGVDLSSGGVAVSNGRPGRWWLTMPESGDVYLGVYSGGIEASLLGTDMPVDVIAGFEELTIVPAGANGDIELRYGPKLPRRLALIGQLFLVGLGAIIAQTRREEFQ